MRLEKLGKILVVVSVVLCAIVVLIGFGRMYVQRKDEGRSLSGDDIESLIMLGISLAVSVIPEGNHGYQYSVLTFQVLWPLQR